MTDAKTFGGVLRRIRKEQGFTSAHQFFKSVGGSKSLGLAFMSYWDIERGKKLPKSWRLVSIMDALGIGPYSAEGQELVKAYFRTLSGSDELLQMLSGPAVPRAELPSRELAEDAAHRAISQLSVTLTLDQWRVRVRDMVTHICQSFLANTAGWVSVAELSAATKFRPDEIRKALKALAGAGMAEFFRDRARSRMEGKVIQLLPLTPATFQVRTALRRNWDAWIADSKRVLTKRCTIRMSKANLNIYRQHLEKAVNLAEVYAGSAENRQESAIYMVDASVYKILPKD